jgi:hypothetical protein
MNVNKSRIRWVSEWLLFNLQFSNLSAILWREGSKLLICNNCCLVPRSRLSRHPLFTSGGFGLLNILAFCVLCVFNYLYVFVQFFVSNIARASGWSVLVFPSVFSNVYMLLLCVSLYLHFTIVIIQINSLQRWIKDVWTVLIEEQDNNYYKLATCFLVWECMTFTNWLALMGVLVVRHFPICLICLYQTYPFYVV